MRIKIRVVGPNKTLTGTKELPAKDHFIAQLKYPKIVQKDKTVYNRKVKHKNKEEIERK